MLTPLAVTVQLGLLEDHWHMYPPEFTVPVNEVAAVETHVGNGTVKGNGAVGSNAMVFVTQLVMVLAWGTVIPRLLVGPGQGAVLLHWP